MNKHCTTTFCSVTEDTAINKQTNLKQQQKATTRQHMIMTATQPQTKIYVSV